MKWAEPKNIRIASTIVALLFSLPLNWTWTTGMYNWFSPFIMLHSVILLKSFVFFNIFGIVVFVLAFFRKRWFCRYLCPVGFGCDAVSKRSFRRRTKLKNIPNAGKWLAFISLGGIILGWPFFMLLDPMVIFNGFFSIFSEDFNLAVALSFSGLPLLLVIHLFFPGIWCGKICPLGGLFDEITSIKNTVKRAFVKNNTQSGPAGINRRIFIASGAGMAAAWLLPGEISKTKNNFIRPPGSSSDTIFNLLCVRCGSCIKTCPTDILIHHRNLDNPFAWMTPEITFKKNGYCLENCNLCGVVCPSGAIFSFSEEAKKELFIATIQIDTENCLLTKQTECDRCKAACSYRALEIMPAENPLLMKPVLTPEKCVGCGACAVICPENVIDMITL